MANEISTARSRRAMKEAADAKKAIRNNAAVEQREREERAALEAKANPKPAKPAAPKLSRRQRVELAHKAAEEQAVRDSLLKPQPVPDHDLPVGSTPPLHILNQRARIANEEARDEATKIALQVGTVTRDLIAGREPRLKRGDRHARYAKATLEMKRQHELVQAAATQQS